MADKLSQEETLKIIVKSLDMKKAESIKVLKIDKISSLADYFVIAGGGADIHARTLTDEAEMKLKASGRVPNNTQGTPNCGWYILDYGDIVVHIFSREQKEFYSLERLWADGEEIDISKWIEQ